MLIVVSLNERALLYVDGKPVRYLGPGRSRVWLAPWSKVAVKRLDTEALVATLRPEEQALIPERELEAISVAAGERALIWKRGHPVMWLQPGEWLVWRVDRSVRLERIDVSDVPAAPLRDNVRALVPAGDYVEATAAAGCTVVRTVDGALDAVLGEGRFAAWTALRRVTLAAIDLRERLLAVQPQEVMTQDRVTLRLTLALSYRVADVRRLAAVARDPEASLYLALQLAAREAVAARTLDQLLAAREELAAELRKSVEERAAAIGASVLELGIKDLVLPGEMKALLNRVIEAQKAAEANVISRREETAAARSMAQTAKVLAENPLLLRLKELETYKELAAKVGKVNLVLGADALGKLELKA